MSKENLVSFTITPEDLGKINAALKTISEVLKPYLVSISTEDRQALPKMNERTTPFVKKVLEYARVHPEFAPSYLNLSELEKDVDAFEALSGVSRPLDELSMALGDTAIQCGSEAYVASLAFYNALKQAVKMNVPGAKVIFEDLKTRFESNGVKAKAKTLVN